MTIKLGNVVRDIITGFKGTVTSRVEYINGCIQYAVLPKMGKDGKAPDAIYYDEKRLEVVSDGIALKTAATGGPQRDAPAY